MEEEEKPIESIFDGDFSFETTEDYGNNRNNSSNRNRCFSRVVGNGKQEK